MAASILTNSSATVALNSLRSTNKALETTTTQISTGKRVGAAKDNAAVFAIAAVQQSDVVGFKALSESLSLGTSTLAVATNGAKAIGSLLNEIKAKIVSANEENVDRQKIQNEITSLTDQIGGIVSAAQFNGLNLIDGSTTTFNTLASLDRDSTGAVTAAQITTDTTGTNLSIDAGTDLLASGVTVDVNTTLPGVTAGGNVSTIAIAGVQEDGTTPLGAITSSDSGADATDTANLLAGDRISVTIGTIQAAYSVRAGDETSDVAAGLRLALVDAGISQDDFTIDSSTTAGSLVITNNTETETNFVVTASRSSGGLGDLAGVDVTDAAGAASALTTIESLIQTTIDAQATLGTAEKRVDLQSEFVQSLTDAFNSGIGALIDADLEAASARLQALQVQQQLGIQSLSIANQQPQNILALFR